MFDADPLRTAIQAYFDGQRRAAIIGGWISAVIIAAALIAVVKGDAFLRGLGLTIGVTALLIGGSGLSLALRDERGLAVLLAGAPATIAAETERMATVVSNYRYYRAAFLAIGALGLILLGLRFGPLCDGISVGLLILAAIGLTIDHYDRQVATTYFKALQFSPVVGHSR